MRRCLCFLVIFAGSASAQELKGPASAAAKPPLNVALTVYLVSGLAQPQPDVKDDVPQDLSETLQQLRGVFTYKVYRLIEAVTLRGRNFSGAEVAGGLADYSHYDFRYARARISPDPPRVVHLDGLRLEISRPHSNRTDTVALVSTDLDVRDGQKTVVGKSAVNGKDALFLVIVPKIVD